MNKDVIQEGPRILLRPVTLDDAGKQYCNWLNDPEVNQYLETRFEEQTIQSIREYVKAMRNDPDVLFQAIILKHGNFHIGNIKLGPVCVRYRRSEISFFVGDKQFWGQGLATEAVGLLTDYALNKLKLIKAAGGVYSNNKGSQRVFEKLGYELEGVLKNHYLSGNVWVDRLCYAKILRAVRV